jgi:sigma-B regulation protein RsbU (phosphoserine phosphatase)
VVTGSDDLADLATASRAIAETETLDELLGVVAELARELIGSREAEVRHLTDGSNLRRSSPVVSREPEGQPVLEAPLLRGDGTCMGVIRLAGKRDRSAWFSPDDERLLTMLGQIASATISHVELLERERRTRRELERERRIVESLWAVGQAISRQLDLHEIIQMATDAATTLTGAASGAFFFRGDDAPPEPTLSTGAAALVGAPDPAWMTPLLAEVFTTDGLVCYEDVTASPPDGSMALHREASGDPPVRSFLGVPVSLADGTVVGAGVLWHVEPGRFTRDDQRLAIGISRQAAVAIANARSLEAERVLARELRRAHTHLEVALAAAKAGNWTWNMATGEVSWSPVLEAIYGFEPGSFPGTFEAYVERIHPDHRAAAIEAIERAVAEPRTFEYRYPIVRLDGHLRWLEGAGQPILDESGALTGMAGVCSDITDRVHSERRTRAELAVTKVLAEKPPIVDTLPLILEAIGEHLGWDLTQLWLEGEGGSLVREHGWTSSPDAYASFVKASEQVHFTRGTGLPGQVWESGRMETVTDVSRDPTFLRAPAALAAGLRGGVAYPIHVAGELVGVLECYRRAPLDEALELLSAMSTIATQLGQFLGRIRAETARRELFEERSRVARVLQQSLLPPRLPEIPGLSLAARYRPGSEEVGGDFYDLFPLAEDEWGLSIGDVCGKGPEAATLTALARHGMHTASIMNRSPASVLTALNDSLRGTDPTGRFCSAVLARLAVGPDGVRVRWASAGHPPLLVSQGGGPLRALTAKGTLLGVFEDIRLDECELLLGPGDLMVLYTDGITEARRGDEFFGLDGLREAVEASRSESVEAIAEGVIAAVEAFDASGDRDDLALVVVGVPA